MQVRRTQRGVGNMDNVRLDLAGIALSKFFISTERGEQGIGQEMFQVARTAVGLSLIDEAKVVFGKEVVDFIDFELFRIKKVQ